MKLKNKTYIFLFLSIAWATLIFVLCTLPTERIPKIEFKPIDKIAHFGVFFVQSVLLSLLFNFQTHKKTYIQIILFSTLMVFVYGGLIEILQENFFNRNGDVYDLIADVIGGFAGAMFFPTFIRVFNYVFKRNKSIQGLTKK
jgi:VanZ family protein